MLEGVCGGFSLCFVDVSTFDIGYLVGEGRMLLLACGDAFVRDSFCHIPVCVHKQASIIFLRMHE